MVKIRIDYEKCIKCGNCIQVCPVEVYELNGEDVKPVKVELCLGCKACEMQCPKGAIEIIIEER